MNDIKLIPITQPKLVNTYTTGPQFLNDIAFLNNDHFVVICSFHMFSICHWKSLTMLDSDVAISTLKP